jgi:formylglycine-generating enzyme required for sulfatase activity
MPRIALLTVAGFLLLTGAFAQGSVRTGTDYAYFFYVTDFEPGWESLPQTASECRQLGEELRTEYGFRVEYFSNLSKAETLRKIEELNARRYGRDDQVLFFFSTHGQFQVASDRGYLIPADGKARDTYGKSWISYDDLGSYITLNPAEHVLLALDACYSGSFGDKWKGQPTADPRYATATDCASQAATALAFDSRIYFTSGGRDQRTPARSLFARRWLEFLRQGRTRGVLTTYDLRYHLGTITDPKPEGGTFTIRHEDGGEFVFVPLRACAERGATEAQDLRHWLTVGSNRGLAIEHLRRYPGCPHHERALAILSSETMIEPRNPGAPYDLGGEPYMVAVPGGSFQMGSAEGEAYEQPVHTVTVSDFRIGRYEVTTGEYLAFAEATGSHYPEWLDPDNEYNIETGSLPFYQDKGYSAQAVSLPITGVDWYDAVSYCNWLSERHGYQPVYTINGKQVTPDWSANGYRLPTEAEWEYVASNRGAGQLWCGTSDPTEISKYANIAGSADDFLSVPAPVGKFAPNELGIYDLTGNVWEWCWDWYAEDYYQQASVRNPRGPVDGKRRVCRGGAFYSTSKECTYYFRGDKWMPSFGAHGGFRLVRNG